jgi:hypothetical protein
MIENLNYSLKNEFLVGWMDGWMDGWTNKKAALLVAYNSNKYIKIKQLTSTLFHR